MDISATFLWVLNSDFQVSCHVAPCLRLLVLKSLQVHLRFFSSGGGGLPVISVTAIANGATMPYWLWYLSLHFGHHAVFILCRISLALQTSKCSLFMAVCSAHHGPVKGAPPSVCFYGWLSSAVITGTSLWGQTGVLTLRAPAQWAAMESGPAGLSTTSWGPSSHDSHTELRPPKNRAVSRLHGITTSKIAFFVVIAVRTSNWTSVSPDTRQTNWDTCPNDTSHV